MAGHFGWAGKVLRVNLTNSKMEVEALDLAKASAFLGARGLAAKYLFDGMDPRIDPLGPDNQLILAVGPLTGTRAAGACRYMAITKSPLTGGIANSNAGGHFPAELRFAGYDMVILTGKSPEPVYLFIDDDRVELRSAARLWGKDTYETQRLIRAETGEKFKIACIGPAGENLVRFAAIMNDNGRAAGRSGVGAVMGSKNLKAVAVRGSGKVPLADEPGFQKACRPIMAVLQSDAAREFSKYGTPGGLAFVNERGVLPTRNFQAGVFESAQSLSGQMLNDTLSTRKDRRGIACHGCPVACGRVSKVSDPDFAGEGDGPEYETIGAFGANCGIGNLPAVAKANYICNEMGMDTISAGMTTACAMELFERGFLSAQEAGGRLCFGNDSLLVKLVADIARREGFGNSLAEGSYRLASRYGHPELSMSVKKQELAAYEPRGLQGLALEYATQNRGGDHVRGEVSCIDLWGVYSWRLCADRNITFTDSSDPVDKPLLAKAVQDWYAVIDAAGMCNFIFFLGCNEQHLLDLLEAATGLSYGGLEGLMRIGERIFNLERLFNLRAGLSGQDDHLPPRLTKEPLPSGPCRGQRVRLDEMLGPYRRLRGWDENGIPTAGKLRELHLTEDS